MSEENLLTPDEQKALTSVAEEVKKATDEDFVEEMLKNNKTEFTHEGVTYRICKLNYEQKQEVYKERVKRFTALLKDRAFSLEKDLKADYLNRGIDVDGMLKKMQSLETKKEDLLLKLGEMLKKDTKEQDCEVYKKEIEKINEEQKAIALERQTLLEFSLENQVLVHMYNYTTYLASEKLVSDNWVKAFTSFDAFLKSTDDTLITKLAFLITMTFNNG
jgi:uncharacterized protein (DUF885 family)